MIDPPGSLLWWPSLKKERAFAKKMAKKLANKVKQLFVAISIKGPYAYSKEKVVVWEN